MFELNNYESNLRRGEPATPYETYQPASDITEISLLIWEEHCIECAAPACFETCDLYQPRPDKRCRRFTFGVYRNKRFESMRGYGVEVSFKKWAKLEARGNTKMEPLETVLKQERAIIRSSPLVSVVGSTMYAVTRDQRWSWLTHSMEERLGRQLHKQSIAGPKPDAFLLEVYNPAADPVNMQLTMTLAKEARDSLTARSAVESSFRTTFTFKKGYTRQEVDRFLFQRVTDLGLPFDIALIPEADTEARLVLITADFVRFSGRTSIRTKVPGVKCVVWDLDNTLWDGVLLEKDDVQLKPGIREMIENLDERGILMSIASKNSYKHAWARLEDLRVADYFLYPQINWMPKSQNIKTIQEKLNIGIDTLAFIDDNPFELEEVAQTHPMIACVTPAEAKDLLEHPRFMGSLTEESRNRRGCYRAAIMREEKQVEFGDNYVGFLATCGIKLDVKAYGKEDLERAAELAQRTNQLNFSGTRYTRAEFAKLLCDESLEKYVLSCADKYGQYGIVGFAVVNQLSSEIRIEDFMLSCRVQGKFIEQAFFHYLHSNLNPQRSERIWVNFRETLKNSPARMVLESLGFQKVNVGPGMFLDVKARSLICDFIETRYLSV
jgi:FkbH-like protein